MTDLARVAPGHPIDVLREQIAPGASDAELAHFSAVCARLDLSPFADQIVLIGRYDKRANDGRGAVVHRPQITVAGRRTLAERSPAWAGCDGPVWCGPHPDGAPLVWREVWNDDENPPYAARCLVYVHGWVKPANGTVRWQEFAQYDSKSPPRLLPLWARMPSHMLGKCAESLALRRAFPDVIGAALAAVGPPPLAGGVYDADDAGVLAEVEAGRADGDAPQPSLPPDPPSPDPTLTPAASGGQGDAHRAVASWPEPERAAFLARWAVTMAEVWPPQAIADAYELDRAEP